MEEGGEKISGDILARVLLGYKESENSESDEIKQKLQLLRQDCFYAGSPMRRADVEYLRAINSPLYEPVPFVMPSAKFSNNYWLGGQHNKPVPPAYTIVGPIRISGYANYQQGIINFVEVGMGISFSHVTFQDTLYIENFKSTQYIKFTNCRFDKGFSIIKSQLTELSFDNCEFVSPDFGIYINGVNMNQVCIRNCVANKMELIVVDRSKSPFKYSNDITHRIASVIIQDSTISDLIIKGKDVLEEIILKDNKSGDWRVDIYSDVFKISDQLNSHSRFKEIKICLIGESDCLSIVKNIYVDTLNIKGYIKKSTLILSAIECEKLFISDLTNEGQFRINNFTLADRGDIEFVDAQFGKADLNTVNFSRAGALRIRSSNISEITTHDVRFPGNITTGVIDDNEGIRAIYRQLKNAANKQGDKVNELRHEQLELQYLVKILDDRKSADRWLLRLNSVTSDHGQNWVKALWWLVGSSTVFFTVITWCLGYRIICCQAFLENIADWLEFLNPVHKYETVFSRSSSPLRQGVAKLLDGSFRIIDSYLLFQLIRASRKYFRN